MVLGPCSPFAAPSSESLPLENAQMIGCRDSLSIGTILLSNSQNTTIDLQTDMHQHGLFSKEMAPPLLPITKPSQPPSADLSSALPVCQECSSKNFISTHSVLTAAYDSGSQTWLHLEAVKHPNAWVMPKTNHRGLVLFCFVLGGENRP